MFDTSLSNIIELIRNAIFPHISSTVLIGGTILAFLLALEIISEALDLSTGRGFKLDKRMVMLLFCAAFITLYPQLADGIWASARHTAHGCTTAIAELGTKYEQAILAIHNNHAANAAKTAAGGMFGGITSLISGDLFQGIGMTIGMLLVQLTYILLYVMVLGAFASLAIVIAIGPIFVAFLLNSSTRGIFMNWVRCILSYILMLPMLHWALKISADIFFDAAKVTMNSTGGFGFSHVLPLLIGPIMGIGIIMHVPKVTAALIGGSGGSGSETIGAIAAGGMTAMYASRGSGGAAARSAGSAVSGGGAVVTGGPHIKASRS